MIGLLSANFRLMAGCLACMQPPTSRDGDYFEKQNNPGIRSNLTRKLVNFDPEYGYILTRKYGQNDQDSLVKILTRKWPI